MPCFQLALVLWAVCGFTRADVIGAVWLTHGRQTPETIVVNWETNGTEACAIEFGDTPALGRSIEQHNKGALHHVELPLGEAGIYYRVRAGSEASAVAFVRGYSEPELRLAIVGNVGFAKADWAAAVLREKPHLLLTAGDHVPALHQGALVPVGNIAAFRDMITKSADLFRTVPVMPVLGNHDREIRPRGPKPPPEPVYDVEATAFREFFALPDLEWRWHFDLPGFDVRLIALDLSHLSDQGTTWQTCHSPAKDGPQFGWYRDLLAQSTQQFVITLYNERNGTVRNLENGAWGRMIRQGSMAVTGFGYFGERAEVDGFPYLNTSVSGTGAKYPDPQSAAFVSEDNFLLLRLRKGASAHAELHSLQGKVLDRREIIGRP